MGNRSKRSFFPRIRTFTLFTNIVSRQGVAQDVVLLRFIAKLGAVETDVLKHVLKLMDVRFFDGMERLIDALTVSVLKAMFVKSVKV